MNTFRILNSGSKTNFGKSTACERQILKSLNGIKHDFSAKKKMTRAVKAAIVSLGHELGHKVYARVFTEKEWTAWSDKNIKKLIGRKKSEFRNKEWLYDVHWYQDIDNPDNDQALHFIPISFELACECEWSKNKAKSLNQNKKDIGYDFQKLLFSNAKQNLFIFRCYGDQQMKDLADYFIIAVESFTCLRSGARFLIVCFRDDELYYLKIVK